MILPILAANVSLVRELDRTAVATCLRRFWSFLLATTVGTVAGMALLSRIPTRPLTAGLGALVLAYVVFAQPYATVPGEAWIRDRCFVPNEWAKVGLGLASGAVFGASNVGVQVPAYLRSLDLDHSTFVGVVAGVFLGISVVRVGVALSVGLFAGASGLSLSVAAIVPGLVGVALGRRLRHRLPESIQAFALFTLLALIAGRLLMRGFGLGLG
jgi:hypothetical protein